MRINLEHKLDNLSIELLRVCGELAEIHQVQACLVGGSVRDILLGLSINDLDISICGDVKKFVATLANQQHCSLLRVSQFGTYMLKYKGLVFDIVTARSESYQSNGALPTVTSGTIDSDLRRRDFTINAIAVTITPTDWGQLIDPLNGLADIKANVLRVIHEKSFQEDPTRILRAVRYAVRLSFEMNSDTKTLLRQSTVFISNVSGARITNEIMKILKETKRADVIELAHNFGILEAIQPNFSVSQTLIDGLRKRDYSNLPDLSIEPEDGFAYLISDLTPETANAVQQRLQLPKSWSSLIKAQTNYPAVTKYLIEPNLKPSTIYFHLKDIPISFLRAKADIEANNVLRNYIGDYLSRYRLVKTELNGTDLKQLGLASKAIGECLKKLLTAKLDGIIAGKSDEIDYVERLVVNVGKLND